MPIENQKPVIFLAFANEQQDGVRYLRSLPDEARELRACLEKAQDDGLCKLEIRTNASADQIIEVFQRWRHQIAVFHYAGHANGYKLLLESFGGVTKVAHGKGLADILAKQHGLQLVFLNGCSTQLQVQPLIDGGIPSVIATSEAIADLVAREFATHFYKGLAEGATIRAAYDDATSAVRFKHGEQTRDLYCEGMPYQERWPWDLYPRNVAEVVETWSLPKAVDNPLFGLPSLPQQDLPDEPFRNLQWFGRKHAEVFFGRGHQIRDLYNKITANDGAPIILFYGRTGVGKSSILEAGVLPRLEASHRVYYRRREQALDLLSTFRAALESDGKTRPSKEVWPALEAQLERPVVILLDQVEEVFTRPNKAHPNELQALCDELQTIFASPATRPRGKLILSFRKERLAEIEEKLSERKLPRARLFVERLDRQGIIEAVSGPSRYQRLIDQYGLTIEDGLSDRIADKLLADPGSPVAPTLQILLTRLWAYATDAKLWGHATDRDFERPHFDTPLYEKLEREGILLSEFLDLQLAKLAAWNSGEVEVGLALDLLRFHTTPEVTAAQHTVDVLETRYSQQQAILPALLQKCKDLYLLVEAKESSSTTSKSTRLAHDTLAPLIRARFDVSTKLGQRARLILKNRAPEWKGDKPGNPLDEVDLGTVEQGARGMRTWTPEEQKLVEASRNARTRRQQKRQTYQILAVVAIAMIILFGGEAWWQKTIAEEQVAISRLEMLTANAGEVLRGYPQLSLLLAVEAFKRSSMKDLEIPKIEVALRKAIINIAELGTPGSPTHFTSALAISNDNRWFVVSQDDGKVLRWDLAAWTRQELAGRHEAEIKSLAISADSRWLVTSDSVGIVWRWDLAAGTGQKLGSHDNRVEDLAISADSHWLVTRDRSGAVWQWDLAAGTKQKLGNPEASIESLVISEDSRWLVTSAQGGVVWRWDLAAGTGQKLGSHDSQVENLAISADSRWLVTSGEDRSVWRWDLVAGTGQKLGSHDNQVENLAISADSRWLVTSGEDRSVWRWDLVAGTGQKLGSHDNRVEDLAISADSRWLVMRDRGGRVWRWDLALGTRQKLGEHKQAIRGMEISKDSRWLVTHARGESVWRWDLDTGTGQKLGDYKQMIRGLEISEDSRWVILHDSKGHLWRWDLATGMGQEMFGHDGQIGSLAISADGRWLVTIDGHDLLRRWDLTTEMGQKLSGHEREVWEMLISEDNQWLVTQDQGGVVWRWDLAVGTGQKLVDSDNIASVAISKDSRWVVTGGSDGKVERWNLVAGTKQELVGHDAAIWEMAISADSHWLVSGDRAGTVWRWDLATGNGLKLRSHDGRINRLVISADSRWLVTGGDNGIVVRWDLAAGTRQILGSYDSRIHMLAISADSRWLVASDLDGGRFWRWDLAVGTKQKLEGPEEAIAQFAISEDSRWLVTQDRSGAVWQWDLAAGTGQKLVGQKEAIAQLAISEDSRWLVTSGQGGRLWRWDLAAGTGKELVGHDAAIWEMAISANSHWLVSGDQAGTVWRWDLAAGSGTELGRHVQSIVQLEITADSRWLVTGDQGGMLRRWDLVIGKGVSLAGHETQITNMAISSNNHWLVTSDDKGLVHRLVFLTEDLVLEAQRATGRNMRQSEWDRYFPGEKCRKTFPDLPDGCLNKSDEVGTSAFFK